MDRCIIVDQRKVIRDRYMLLVIKLVIFIEFNYIENKWKKIFHPCSLSFKLDNIFG